MNPDAKKKIYFQMLKISPWEHTHGDFFEVLEVLERTKFFFYKDNKPHSLSQWCECFMHCVSMLPVAVGSRTGGLCAWHPEACCVRPQAYPESQSDTKPRCKWHREHPTSQRQTVNGFQMMKSLRETTIYLNNKTLTDLEMAWMTLEKPTASFSSSYEKNAWGEKTID